VLVHDERGELARVVRNAVVKVVSLPESLGHSPVQLVLKVFYGVGGVEGYRRPPPVALRYDEGLRVIEEEPAVRVPELVDVTELRVHTCHLADVSRLEGSDLGVVPG